MQPRLGIYIHIPFCASKCGYCDFYSCAGAAERMAEYQQALLEHIEESAGRIAPAYIDTVYFGGGTPSFYGAARLIELLDAVKATGRLLKRAEVTVEVNPDSVRLHDLRALRKAGFNDHEILEAAFVAGFFNYTNRWVSTIAPVANPGHFSHNRNFEG